MIRPLNDGIVVRPDEAPDSASAVLYVKPDEQLTGVVVAAGPGKWRANGTRAPMWVKEGDHIYFSGTMDRKYEGHLLMKCGDVIGLVE